MALSNKDIAKLYTKLELPIVVGDAIDEERVLAPDEEYAFHQALSDMQPDAALLCIALSSEQIYSALLTDMPEAAALVMEADRLVAAYGGLWLARLINDSPVPEEFIVEALKSLPRDFARIGEAMAELESALCGRMEHVSQFLSIMQIQAQAQSLIAESFLEALGLAVPEDTQEDRAYFSYGANANDNGGVFDIRN